MKIATRQLYGGHVRNSPQKHPCVCNMTATTSLSHERRAAIFTAVCFSGSVCSCLCENFTFLLAIFSIFCQLLLQFGNENMDVAKCWLYYDVHQKIEILDPFCHKSTIEFFTSLYPKCWTS
jgi:hypothetical protein